MQFTLERHSDFSGNWLPTLDFKVRPDFTNNRLEHTYFEKSMNTKWTIPSISAMDPASKRQILANEMARRLARIDPVNFNFFATEVMNQFDKKLIFSGYEMEDRRRIVEGGISNYFEEKGNNRGKERVLLQDKTRQRDAD